MREPYAPPFDANLLLISLDTTRADHLSAYGYGRPTSPRLEQLTRESHRFDAAYTVMAMTLPSHASMFTSLYPTQLGVRRNGTVVPEGATTLSERLRDAGFETAAFVSAAVMRPFLNLDQGFTTYVDPRAGVAAAEEVRERTSRWIETHRNERFFVFVHLFDPHTDYDPPDAFRPLFAVPAGSFPPTRPGGRRIREEVAASIRAYDAEIRYADAEIGRLLDDLEALGLLERTLVVFVSDHGETLDELLERHDYGFEHGDFLHERELRVPLLLRLPAGFPHREPRVHRAAVSTLDLMPTLLELLGVPVEPPFEGRSLVPLLGGGSIAPRPVVSERRLPGRAERLVGDEQLSVFFGPWHAIVTDGRLEALYDLRVDPRERASVAERNPEVAHRLARVLDAWKAHVEGSRLAPERSLALDPELVRELEALGYAVEP